jgi:hypothetical protein
MKDTFKHKVELEMIAVLNEWAGLVLKALAVIAFVLLIYFIGHSFGFSEGAAYAKSNLC